MKLKKYGAWKSSTVAEEHYANSLSNKINTASTISNSINNTNSNHNSRKRQSTFSDDNIDTKKKFKKQRIFKNCTFNITNCTVHISNDNLL